MKITAVKTIRLACSCNTIADALSVCSRRQALIIKIETDTELYGIGEAFTYGCTLEAVKCLIDNQLAPHLMGQDPAYIERIWNMLFWRTAAFGRRGIIMGAVSGLDIALWDLLGKAAGLPVSKLLGAHSDDIPSYASGGFYAPGKDLGELRKEAEGYMDAGYRDVKIKIGRNPGMAENPVNYMADRRFGVTYEEDLRRIETVRSVIGKGRLIADLNAAWCTDRVIGAREDLENCGVDWLEEPVRFEDLEGCRKIADCFEKIQIIGYETEQGLDGFYHMIENRSTDIVQPDIGWAGGFSECRKIAALSAAAHRPVSLHSFGSAVHFAASLQLAGSISNIEAIESETNENALKTQILKRPFETDTHMNFHVPDGPGLGIELDWDKLEQWTV